MAEAHEAVAFQFTVGTEGCHLQFISFVDMHSSLFVFFVSNRR